MNFWGFPAAIVPCIEDALGTFLQQNIDDLEAEYLLPDVVDGLIDGGRARVRVLPRGGPWFGVTYQEDRDGVVGSIRGLIELGVYPERLWG